MKKQLVPLGVVILFGLIGVKALYQPGLWTAHDIWHNVTRFYWYVTALKEGQLLPAWIAPMANGYGYPLFIFSYHLPWLIGAFWMLLGVGWENALKLVYGLSFITAGLIMYGFAVRVLKDKWAAMTSAILYMWAPYHFLVILVAAAAGIAWAYALVPLIFWGIWEIVVNKDKRGVGLLSIGIAGVCLSHLIFAVMLVFFVLLWLAWLISVWKISREEIREIMVGGLLGLGMAAFYLIPFFVYSPMIKASDPGLGFRNLYQTNFASIKQLIYSKWGFGPIVSNAKDGEISLQVGIAQWLALGGMIIALVFKKTKAKPALIFASMYLIVVFTISEYAKPIWDLVAKFMALDYPFRLLTVAVLFGALIAGTLVKAVIKMQLKLGIITLLILTSWYTNRNHTRVNLYTQIPIQDYVEAEKTTNTLDEYLPQSADRSLINKPRVNEWTQWAFPGQELTVNKKKVTYSVSKDGLIELPSGATGQINISYHKPWPFIVGQGLSVLAFVGWVKAAIWKKNKK